MKKLILIACLTIASLTVYAQTNRQLNFGLIGISYELPINSEIAVAPFAGTNINLSFLTLGVKGNYYFDKLLDLPQEFDFYGGINAGYALAVDNSSTNDFDIGLQLGGRWFWNDKWGLYLEFGGGKITATGGLGITMKL